MQSNLDIQVVQLCEEAPDGLFIPCSMQQHKSYMASRREGGDEEVVELVNDSKEHGACEARFYNRSPEAPPSVGAEPVLQILLFKADGPLHQRNPDVHVKARLPHLSIWWFHTPPLHSGHF